MSVTIRDVAQASGVHVSTVSRTFSAPHLVNAETRTPVLAAADDPEALRQLGIEHCAELCQELLDAGAPGIHFITMNRSTATREVFGLLGAKAASTATL